MLSSFRKFGATRTSKALLIILTGSFAAWGIGGYLMHSSGYAGVSVNGEDISITRLDEAYKQRVNAVAQALGQKPGADELAQMHLAENVVNEAVARTILRQTAANLGLVAAMKQLQEEIAGNPIFHNDSGAFDPARYRALVQRIGKTPEQFEQEMAQDLGVRLLGQTIRVDTVSPSALAPLAALEKATLTLQIATLTPAQAGKIEAPSDKDLQQFYELNQKLYTKPEKRSFSVLTLDRATVAPTIDVSDEQARKEYDANPTAFALPEKRTVRHILVDTEDKAKALVPQIKSLADFEKVANAHSTDPGNKGQGGLLGSIAKGDVVPAFGDAAFALAPSTLSKPVQSPFGWHLIWVEKVDPARNRDFAEVKDEIKGHLKASETDDALADMARKVDEKVAAGDSLASIAKSLGLKADPIAQVTADDQSVDPRLLEAGFSTAQDAVSAPIPTKDGGATYVQVTAVTLATVPPLAELKDRVAKDWTALQTTLAVQKASDKVLAAARAPGVRDLGASVANSGVSGVTVQTLRVASLEQVPEWLHRRLLDVFQQPEGAVLPTAVKDGDDWHIVRLAKREMANPTQADLESVAKVYQQRLQADVEALVVAYLQGTAKVKCNQANLKQVFGREISCD